MHQQFWTTAKVKNINDEVRIQALIDEKRVNIKESSIHCILKLDDAEGTSCLANAEILDVKNIEAGVPFFMFPRFMQLLIDHQLGDMSHHKDIYANPSLTKKVFSYMKMVGAGFSGVVNALFDNMLVPTAEEVGLIQDDVQAVPIPTEPSTSKPHKKHKSKKQQPKVPSLEPSHEHKLPLPSNDPLHGELESEVIDIKSTSKEKIEKLVGRVAKLEEENRAQAKLYKIHLKHPEKVLSMQVVDEEELAKVEEVVKAAKLMTEVVTTVGATTTADAPKVSVLRKRRGVIIQDPEETTSTIVMHSKEEVNEEVTLPEKEIEVEAYKREGKSLEKEISKKQKMNEEAKELRSHLQIVPNDDDDDVYTEATPLASKIPIVDYKI
uniref:Uncharacterized protein n=1 Tax=Tanacetum cinerariifolium TaxID=118510 RepID=A0A699IP99_TANCI|nr:hypothetical protein [Tanacetum cinerariifolium]